MKRYIAMGIVGLTTLLLVGCGGGSGGDTSSSPEIGTWVSAEDYNNGNYCVNGGYDLSYKETITLDGSKLTIINAMYAGSDCQGDIIDEEKGSFEYKLGDKTTASKGEEAYEFDYINPDDDGITYYGMIAFMKDETLGKDTLIATDNEGITPETRDNVLDYSTKLIKIN